MVFKYIGLDINENELINNTYKTYMGKTKAKFNTNTNFKTGHIQYEDGVFLPEGSYVLIKEIGKPDLIGKIFYYVSFCQEKQDTYYNVAIVNVNYDMDSSKNRNEMNSSLIIDFINKDIYFNLDENRYHNKYLQLISYEQNEDDKWKFVRVEYGNQGTKMFYMFGYKYYDGNIYQNKNVNSNTLKCFNHIYNYIQIYHDTESDAKITNTEFIKEHNNILIPYESELIIVYIILMCVSFIFKDFIILWITLTFIFHVIRKNMRNNYNK